MKKTIIKFVMAVLVALFSLNANAYDVEIDGIYYNLYSSLKTASVVSGNNKYSGVVSIPSSFWYGGINYSVTSIEANAFNECSGLTSLTIPKNIYNISYYAFTGCTGIKSINVASDNEFYTSHNGCNAIIESASNTLILGCENTIIPNDVTCIGRSAFNGSVGLTSITIPNSVTKIDEYAFADCENLEEITIPSSVKVIGKEVLGGTKWLKQKPNGWVYVGTILYCYKGSSLLNGTISINDGTTSIAGGAFQYYRMISVTIPNSVTSIGDECFRSCPNMTSVNIPNGVTEIGRYTFSGCNSLASIILPEGLTSIRMSAFQSCSSLASITIPSSITFIGQQAFYGCNNLHSVVSEINEPFDFGLSAFSGIASNCTLTVPYGTKDAYIAKGWTENVFQGGIIEAPDNPASRNKLTIGNIEVCKGKSFVLPVNMNNSEFITALQFEVTLPTGIALSKCQLTDRKGEDHTASCKKLTNGNYQVTVLSLSKAVFSGTEGALVNLTLDAADNMTADDYDISLTNIELTTADTQAINPADVTATLTVSDVKIADADGNGKVSITDAVAIVSHILGDDIDGFVAAAADVDGNGRITITDAVAVVDMILNGSASAKGRVGMDEEELDPQ